MFNCPVCSNTLQRIEYEGLPVFNCENCAGYLVKSRRVGDIENRRIKSEEDLKTEALDAATPDSEQDLRCPRCHRKMEKDVWKSPDLFCLDKCNDCDLIWFDAGELASLQLYYEGSTVGKDAFEFQRRLREMTPERRAQFEKNLARLPEGDVSPLSAFGQAFGELASHYSRSSRPS